MAAATAAVALAGTSALAAYVDAKFHISKDVHTIRRIQAGERKFAQALRNNKASVFYQFEDSVNLHSSHLALWSRSGIYTYSQLYTRVCQYANFLLSLDIKPGDLVGMYLINCPEFMIIVLATWAIGCAPAMVNYNLAGDPLIHCVKISGAKVLIVDEDEGCQARVKASEARMAEELGVKTVTLSEQLMEKIAQWDDSRPEDELRDVVNHADSPGLLIFTSGTTGLPKAFPFTVGRIYPMSLSRAFDQVPGKDIWYDPMPLYHGTGVTVAIASIMQGTGLAIGRSFSIRNFWKDVRDSQATMFVYVGETARYLLSAPPSPLDTQHRIRLMFGNGLRPDVWGKFQARFAVAEVVEFFNSTEGMFGTVIHSRSGFGRGSVGHNGLIQRRQLRHTYVPVALDSATGDMWRHPTTGFAKRVAYSRGGEILVKMPTERSWPGYWRAPEATGKKLARDVFEKGDLWYRPGDALRRDDDGLWYFLDRLGDTFRWKGENVSTAQVGEVLGRFEGVVEANVYGVLLPGHDGRAGCAALDLCAEKVGERGERLDWTRLAAWLRERLPRFAVPLFVRVNGKVGGMGTHNNKQDKVKLREEGVDPRLRGTRVDGGKADWMWWLPPKAEAYVPFGQKEWDDFEKGALKL